MKHVVYILQSQQHGKYYVGHCRNVAIRLARHNAGRVRATKYGIPWKIILTEEYPLKQDAYRREMKIKSYKGGEAFKKLINNL